MRVIDDGVADNWPADDGAGEVRPDAEVRHSRVAVLAIVGYLGGRAPQSIWHNRAH